MCGVTVRVTGYVGVLLGGKSVELKDIEQVVELSVDVSAHCEAFLLKQVPPGGCVSRRWDAI